MHYPTAVDLFCGCGGVTEGLKRSRFKVVAAVDNNRVACQTYKKNHPRVHLYNINIDEVDPQEIRHKHLDGKNLDLLVVCAPCQPFSSQNKGTPSTNRQLKLILNAVKYVSALQPKLIFFENVAGITGDKFGFIIEELSTKLNKRGYTVGEPKILDAADFGVPQRRKRAIMLARKGDAVPNISKSELGTKRTVRDAIGDLPILRAGENSDDPMHFARNHKSISLERLSFIPKDGGSRDTLPENLVLDCHKGYTGHPDVYGRMSWDDVAPTLTTGCTDMTKGRFVHPSEDRAITLREAARLQTFPDKYIFCGTSSDIATQIGNAVPVRLVENVAAIIKQMLTN